MDIIYSISADTANGLLDETLLSQEILASGISVPATGLLNLLKMERLSDVLTITYIPGLTISDSGVSDGVVAAHSGAAITGIIPGPTGDIIQEAIDEHAAIVDAHHVRYTDAEASGVAVQVATTGIEEAITNHTADVAAHHTRYTDAEAIIAATGNVTLQTAYDAGGLPPHIITSVLDGPVTLRSNSSNSTMLALQDAGGTTEHYWNDHQIFMGPGVGNILAASVSGINLSPALFPGRPTVNFGLDQLNILPAARTITSNFTKISFSDTYTLDFPAASFGAALGLNATILLRQAGGPFGMGLLFNNAVTWSNDSGFAVNLGSAFSFVDQPFYRADGATITQPIVRSMISQPRFIVTGGGDLTLGTLQHYFAGGAINLGVHIGDRIVFDAFNPAPFTGEITGNHIALRIANLTDGGGGASICGVQSSMNNGLFLEQLGTAPSEHLSEFRIGSTLAHIGDTDTNLTFTTDQIDLNASGVNSLRVFANGAGNFVSINPGLNDIDLFVNGGTTAGLIRTEAGIDGLGFHGATPIAQTPAYTVTSGITDRSFNANATTLDEISDVLGTLIIDLQTKGLLG